MAAPVNDNFASATDLGSALSGSVTGTNVDATTEVGEPLVLNDGSYVPGILGLYSVWWKWTAPNGVTVGDWVPLDNPGFTSTAGYFGGSYLRLFHLVTVAEIPTDAEWTGPALAGDNVDDATGMTQEINMFVGFPGLVSQINYWLEDPPEVWDLHERFVTLVDTYSSGYQPQASPSSPDVGGGVDEFTSIWVNPATGDQTIPAGTDVWLLAVQWPNSFGFSPPGNPPVSWDPTADMGSWTLSDGVTPLTPWDLADLVEVPLGPPLPGQGMNFDTFGSQTAGGDTMDTLLDVWVHPSDDEWMMLGGNDDAGTDPVNPESEGTTSQTAFQVVGGLELLIRVTGKDAVQVGTAHLNWERISSAPVNDEITNATVIPALAVTGTVSSDNTNATASETFAYTGVGRSVWWKWTPTVNLSVTFSGSNPNPFLWPRLDVYTSSGTPDDTGASLTSVAGDGDGSAAPTVTFDATAGMTYWVRMDMLDAGLGPVSLSWSAIPAPPANDNRADAVTLTGTTGSETYTTYGATDEIVDGEPAGADSLAGDLSSIWYLWSPGYDGSAVLTADAGTYIEMFAVDDAGITPLGNPVALCAPVLASTEAAVTSPSFTAPVGERIVVLASLFTGSSTGATTFAITDTLGLTWTEVTANEGAVGNESVASIFHAVGNGATGTVTVTPSHTGDPNIGMTLDVLSVSGQAGVGATGTSAGSSPVVLSAAPASTSEVIALRVDGQGFDPAQAAPTGMTALFTDRHIGPYLYNTAAYKNGSAAQSMTFAGSLGDGAGVAIEITAATSWSDLLRIGGGLAAVTVGIRSDETFAVRLYPIDSSAPSAGATFGYDVAEGAGGSGGTGVATGVIALTLPLLTVPTPGVLIASIIDEAAGEEFQVTVDGDSIVLVDDFIDDDGTWDGGIPLGELTDGDHYVTVTAGSRTGQIGFTVTNDITYHSDPATPAAPTLPTVVSGEWVL